jgi:hypothetical protein
MELLTQAELSRESGKSKQAISKALKEGRLDYFQDTRKINRNSPKTQKFLVTVGQGQKNIVQGVTGGTVQEPDEETKDAAKKVLLAQEKKIIEEADFKEQQKIEKQIKNAVRTGELIESDLIDKYQMVFIDRIFNQMDREFSALFDEIWATAQAEIKPKNEIKRSCILAFRGWRNDAIQGLVDELSEIKKIQAKA